MKPSTSPKCHQCDGSGKVVKYVFPDVADIVDCLGCKGSGSNGEVIANSRAATELGERKAPRGNQIGWATRKLRQGFYLARYGWDLDTRPKRCFAYLDGNGSLEAVKVRREDGTTELLKLSWQDVSVRDWYIPENLELVR